MKASYLDQLNLLTLQGLDKKESSLLHRRNTHPAHTRVNELAGRADDLQRASITQSAVIADIEREIARISHEIELVEARRKRQQDRLDQNQVPLRDISPMEHEIAQMEQRIRKLEEDQLSAEEQHEAASHARTAMVTEAKAIAADVEATKAAFAEDIKELDEQLRAVIAQRKELVSALPDDLVAEYERAKKNMGALAVVEVRNGVGMGGAADLSPLELDQIRRTPDDELYWTEDTGQIVVRTTGA